VNNRWAEKETFTNGNAFISISTCVIDYRCTKNFTINIANYLFSAKAFDLSKNG